MNKLVSNGFVFFCFCPYVSIVPIPSVTQPIAFFFSIAFILLNKIIKVKKELLIAAVPFFVVLVTSSYYLSDISVWRSIIGYLSFFTFTIAAYLFFKNKNIDDFIAILKVVTAVWMFFGLLHFATGIDISGPFKLSPFDISDSRGVLSLATEPSYYGLICFFIFIFLDIVELKDSTRNFMRYKLLLFFQVLFLAQSTITLLYFILYFLLKFIVKKSYFKYIITMVLFSIVLVIVLSNVDFSGETPRLLHLINLIMENPTTVLKLDASINHRVNHIIFSVLASIENYTIPISIVRWTSIYESYAIQYSNWVTWAPGASRIMSGFGGMFFELGIFGFSIVFLVVRAIKYSLKGSYASISLILFLNIVMFSAIPIAFPPFGFLIGFLFGSQPFEGSKVMSLSQS